MTATTTTTKDKTCKDCESVIGRSLWTLWEPNEYDCENENCNAHLCLKCINKHPLYVVVPEDAQPHDMDHAQMKKFCKSCFQTKSYIDFTKTFDVMEGSSSGFIFLFVHGGAGSRAMFHAHAAELNKRYGHKSILMDLPGHGSLVETPLTLDTCVATLEGVCKASGITKDSKEKIIYVGVSLGAYTGFYMLDKVKDIFDGAILIDCGQNVGPEASFKAKMGLVFLSFLSRNMSNASLMAMMAGEIKKSADYKLLETSFGSGMFFDQGEAQVNCLRSVAPAELIPKLNIPILFMNGGKDYRDSENKWLELCVNKKSELKVYEEGDHFFLHLSRFVDDILTRFDTIAKAL